MRYLLISVSILAALCLGLLIAPLLTPRPKPVEGSLVINQRVYLPQELEERIRTTPYHFDNKEDLVTDLIYRELLLQEAKAQKIDNEASFLRSMRDFYEQSMIKTLLDRQYALDTHLPNESQVAACQPFLTRNFDLKRFDYDSLASAQANQPSRVATYDLPYLQLPEDIRSGLLTLKGGELSEPIHSGSGWFRLQLIDIKPLPASQIPDTLQQEELCRDELKRQSIQAWVESLFRKSDISRPQVTKEGNNG